VQRPAGVTIIAVLGLILGALVLMAGLWVVFSGRWLVVSEMSFGTALGGVVLLGLAALVIITSVGLLNLQEWARVLAIVLNAVHLVVAALGLMESFRHIRIPFFFGMMLRHILMIAIGVWIIVYLIQPHVKQAFRRPTPAPS
jgi:hypothetical protein